ncbi:hypothetical protein E3O06_14295 [Cryobacterium glaciale]|uniref:Uncharacterized protein n=1 Tax=Cryobacterium glaciale TaxID=1259145 RepID=A0A4R8UUM0_9MICO|nr:hypothetical protein [Cryobacterium glaciale]TFB70622.1 hypothetical protein E3O06_14295 [Cryobacterium glaciale]
MCDRLLPLRIHTGWETLCEAQVSSGYSVDGSFGEYMIGEVNTVLDEMRHGKIDGRVVIQY